MKQRLVKSLIVINQFIVAFRIFVLVFISKELLPKSRIVVKIGLVKLI